MRKEFITGVLALIGLGGIVVLGGSHEFIGDVLGSAQNNPIVRAFSFSKQSESEKSAENAEKRFGEPPLTKTEPIYSEIPDYVLYDTVFRLDTKFRSMASDQEAAGQIPTSFKYYFKNEAGLTEEEDLILKQVASEFFGEVQPIDNQAQTVIESGETGEASMADALNSLQEQRNSVVLSNKDKLTNRLGGNAFDRLDQFVKGDFALHFTSYQPLSN